MPSCLQTFLSVVVDMPSTSAASFCSGERSQQRRARAGSSEPQPRRATRPQRKHGQAARVGAGWQTCWTQNRGSTVLRWIFRSLPPCARQRRRAVRVREARGKVEPFGRGAHAGDTEARGPRRRAARTHTDAACACPLGHPTDLRRGQTVTEPAADCTSVQRRTAGSLAARARTAPVARTARRAAARTRANAAYLARAQGPRAWRPKGTDGTNAPTRACAVVDGQVGNRQSRPGASLRFFFVGVRFYSNFGKRCKGQKFALCLLRSTSSLFKPTGNWFFAIFLAAWQSQVKVCTRKTQKRSFPGL